MGTNNSNTSGDLATGDQRPVSADEIERELHRRFAEEVYVGMGVSDYHAALAHVVIRYIAESMAGGNG